MWSHLRIELFLSLSLPLYSCVYDGPERAEPESSHLLTTFIRIYGWYVIYSAQNSRVHTKFIGFFVRNTKYRGAQKGGARKLLSLFAQVRAGDIW